MRARPGGRRAEPCAKCPGRAGTCALPAPSRSWECPAGARWAGARVARPGSLWAPCGPAPPGPTDHRGGARRRFTVSVVAGKRDVAPSRLGPRGPAAGPRAPRSHLPLPRRCGEKGRDRKPRQGSSGGFLTVRSGSRRGPGPFQIHIPSPARPCSPGRALCGLLAGGRPRPPVGAAGVGEPRFSPPVTRALAPRTAGLSELSVQPTCARSARGIGEATTTPRRPCFTSGLSTAPMALGSRGCARAGRARRSRPETRGARVRPGRRDGPAPAHQAPRPGPRGLRAETWGLAGRLRDEAPQQRDPSARGPRGGRAPGPAPRPGFQDRSGQRTGRPGRPWCVTPDPGGRAGDRERGGGSGLGSARGRRRPGGGSG